MHKSALLTANSVHFFNKLMKPTALKQSKDDMYSIHIQASLLSGSQNLISFQPLKLQERSAFAFLRLFNALYILYMYIK